jgi:hypothetical protein
MTFGSREPRAAGGRDIVLLLVAAAGLAGSITLIFLGMRAVMEIGGACADGGPFVPVQPCPAGVPLLMTLSIFGLIGFAGLGLYAGAAVGGPWVALPLVAWPALFLSLGWNFLEYGFWPPGGMGWEWGWVIPGILFVIMGGAPLVFVWTSRREFAGEHGGVALASTFGVPVPSGRAVKVSFAPRSVVGGGVGGGFSVRAGAGTAAADGDLVARLERLAHLRRTGDLTNQEFEVAKAALLADASAAPALAPAPAPEASQP